MRSICYPESAKFTTTATQYGCEHEHKAVDAYKLKQLQLHQELKIIPAGFVVYLILVHHQTHTYVECLCCGPGVLEVKCPYCMRTEGFNAALERSSFCLDRSNDGKLALHPYYYQCQLQMVATTRSYCDFVVWTASEEPHIERILFDRMFIEEKLQQAEKLFWLAIIPELLGKWFTRDHTKLPIVAAITDGDDDSSEDDDGGSMIGCENSSCAIKWFHMSCLRMKNIPKKKWFCPSCHTKLKATK